MAPKGDSPGKAGSLHRLWGKKRRVDEDDAGIRSPRKRPAGWFKDAVVHLRRARDRETGMEHERSLFLTPQLSLFMSLLLPPSPLSVDDDFSESVPGLAFARRTSTTGSPARTQRTSAGRSRATAMRRVARRRAMTLVVGADTAGLCQACISLKIPKKLVRYVGTCYTIVLCLCRFVFSLFVILSVFCRSVLKYPGRRRNELRVTRRRQRLVRSQGSRRRRRPSPSRQQRKNRREHGRPMSRHWRTSCHVRCECDIRQRQMHLRGWRSEHISLHIFPEGNVEELVAVANWFARKTHVYQPYGRV